jgi:mRNA interferase RelE/StbE
MYDIAWNKRALKALKRISVMDAEKIYMAVQSLRNWPDCKNVVSLKNHKNSYRLRSGRYRVLFDVDEVIRIILIEDVRKRDERAY